MAETATNGAKPGQFAPTGALPGSLSSRHVKGDVAWGQWHPGRQVDLIRQIADHGGLLTGPKSHSAINAKAWKARTERLFLSLAAHPDLVKGVGLLRIMLVERSFMGRAKPNEVGQCNARTAKRPEGQVPTLANGKKKDLKEPGPLALRCGLKPATVYSLNKRRREEGLLSVKKQRYADTNKQKPNEYDFSTDLLSELRRHIDARKFKLAAAIHVAEFLLTKFQRSKGYSEFARRELGACGLASAEWAEAALHWLIAKGYFVVIGFGRVTLPEFVHSGCFKALECWEIWVLRKTDPDSEKSAPESVPRHSGDHTQLLRKADPGSLRIACPAFAPGSRPDELREGSREQHEVEELREDDEQREDDNSTSYSVSSPDSLVQIFEPHEPDYGSGKPSPSSGEENGRNDGEGKQHTQEPEGQLVTSMTTSASKSLAYDVEAWRREVVAAGDNYNEGCRRLEALVPVDELANRVSMAIGPVMPESKRWHRQAVGQWMLHKFRKVLMAGADDTWLVQTVQDIGHEALRAGHSFPDWRSVSLRFDLALKNKLGGEP